MWGLVPWPGSDLGPPALGVWNLSHWATREVLSVFLFFNQCVLCLFLKSLSIPRLWRLWKSLYFLLQAFLFYLLQLGIWSTWAYLDLVWGRCFPHGCQVDLALFIEYNYKSWSRVHVDQTVLFCYPKGDCKPRSHKALKAVTMETAAHAEVEEKGSVAPTKGEGCPLGSAAVGPKQGCPEWPWLGCLHSCPGLASALQAQTSYLAGVPKLVDGTACFVNKNLPLLTKFWHLPRPHPSLHAAAHKPSTFQPWLLHFLK